MNRRPTAHDVASLAGVSQKTVSRVLLNQPNVTDEKRRLVEDAVASLGYRRNDSARALRPGQRTMIVGLVVGDISNPWYSTVASVVETLVAQKGYLLITGSTSDGAEREKEIVLRLCEHRVDGLLIFPSAGDQNYLAAEIANGVQMVFLDRPPVNLEADAVIPPHRDASRRAVTHMIERGHRRIGFIGAGEEIGYSVSERIAGYREALADAGIEFDPELLRLGALDPVGAHVAVESLLALTDPPTALYTANNRVTIGALEVLGGSLGGLALVGFDDFELAELLPVPITVIAHDPAELAREGVSMLLERISGLDEPARSRVVPATLIERGSGEIGHAK